MLTHAQFTFRISILADQITCLQCTGHQNASACENTSGQELKQSTTQLTFMPSLPSSPSLPSWGLQLLPSSPSLPWCWVFGEPGNVAEIAIITLSHATRRVLLSLREYLLQHLFKHTQYLYLNVGRSEGSPAPMGYLVPGRMWHGAWTTLLYNINTWNLCRHRFVAYIEIIFHPFPAAFAMLHLVVVEKICSTQSVKVIRYVSLYLYAFPYLPIHYFFIPSLLSHGVYYLCFLIRTWQRINMVRNLARQVKFELDQADWVLGILTRRLCNVDTWTCHFLFIFAQKCSSQSVKVIPYISLYLDVVLPLPIMYAYPHSYTMGAITYGFC